MFRKWVVGNSEWNGLPLHAWTEDKPHTINQLNRRIIAYNCNYQRSCFLTNHRSRGFEKIAVVFLHDLK